MAEFVKKVVYLIVRAIRIFLCPYTSVLGGELNHLDSLFCDMFFFVICRSSPLGSWKRIIRELITDMVVRKTEDVLSIINSKVQQIVNAVFDRNVTVLMEYIVQSDAVIYPTFLKYLSLATMSLPNLDGMMLMHCAAMQLPMLSNIIIDDASVMTNQLQKEVADLQLYELLIQIGCHCMCTNSSLHNPLHIAAKTLNSCYIGFVSLQKIRYSARVTVALEMQDVDGYQPIDSLVQSISLMNWRRRISSKQLESCILSLLPGEDYVSIWSHRPYSYSSTTPINGSNNMEQEQEIDPFLSVFFCSIVFGDDYIAAAVLKVARKWKQYWNYNVIKTTILQCVRRKRDQTVILLLQEFGKEMFGREILNTFLSHCVAEAVVVVESSVMINIFVRILCDNYSDAHAAQSIKALNSFMHVVALNGSDSVLKAVLSACSAQFLWDILIACPQINGVKDSFVLTNYANFSHDILLRIFQEVSPLSLFCMLPGRATTVQLLLKATAHCRKETNGGNENEIAESQLVSVFSNPIGFSVLTNNFRSLNTIRMCLGNTSFARLLIGSDFHDYFCN